jgi:hypothetical protein
MLALGPLTPVAMQEVYNAASNHRVVSVTGNAAAKLIANWDDTDPTQVERGYCVTSFTALYVEDSVNTLEIKDIRPGDVLVVKGVRQETPKSLVFYCPDGAMSIHTHPPTTCKNWDNLSTCYIGGPWAHICFPSPDDMRTAGTDYAMLQCDKHKLVLYSGIGYRKILTI